jgi:hypothetical protein
MNFSHISKFEILGCDTCPPSYITWATSVHSLTPASWPMASISRITHPTPCRPSSHKLLTRAPWPDSLKSLIPRPVTSFSKTALSPQHHDFPLTNRSPPPHDLALLNRSPLPSWPTSPLSFTLIMWPPLLNHSPSPSDLHVLYSSPHPIPPSLKSLTTPSSLPLNGSLNSYSDPSFLY